METLATTKEVTTKVTVVIDGEEAPEEAGAVMDSLTGDSVIFVKMTQDSITSPCIVPIFRPQHLGDSNLKPQVDVIAAPAKYMQVNANNHENVNTTQVRYTGSTCVWENPTLVKMLDNHCNK